MARALRYLGLTLLLAPLAAPVAAAPLAAPFAARAAVALVTLEVDARTGAAAFAGIAGEVAAAAMGLVGLRVEALAAAARAIGTGVAILLDRVGADPAHADIVGAGIAVVGAGGGVRLVDTLAVLADIIGAGVAVAGARAAVWAFAVGRAIDGAASTDLSHVALARGRPAHCTGIFEEGYAGQTDTFLRPAIKRFVAGLGVAGSARPARRSAVRAVAASPASTRRREVVAQMRAMRSKRWGPWICLLDVPRRRGPPCHRPPAADRGVAHGESAAL